METLGLQVRVRAMARMHNQAMLRKLLTGDAIDVRSVGTEVEPGVFEISAFVDECDYCDAEKEQWIWSVGRRRSDGRIFAAVDARFYATGVFECLWLR
jgi:hypothetical protein